MGIDGGAKSESKVTSRPVRISAATMKSGSKLIPKDVSPQGREHVGFLGALVL